MSKAFEKLMERTAVARAAEVDAKRAADRARIAGWGAEQAQRYILTCSPQQLVGGMAWRRRNDQCLPGTPIPPLIPPHGERPGDHIVRITIGAYSLGFRRGERVRSAANADFTVSTLAMVADAGRFGMVCVAKGYVDPLWTGVKIVAVHDRVCFGEFHYGPLEELDEQWLVSHRPVVAP